MALTISNNWTLFIDRDGVINKEKKEQYILNYAEFEFYENAKKAFAIFNKYFGLIILVTNQRGVGRGLMQLKDLENIHNNMLHEIEEANGRIDKIYFCTDTDNNSPNRKPNAGMAFMAKRDFANINFSQSLMVGNKLSDMQFGRNAGVQTVFLSTTNPEVEFPNALIDYRFNDLYEFALAIENKSL